MQVAIVQPGNGSSKKARQRRNRRNRNTQITTITTNRNLPVQTISTTRTKSRRRRNRNRLRNPIMNNLFLATLRDPEGVTGVKWPGPTGFPTGTFQMTTDIIATTLSDGSFSLIANPYILTGTTTPYGVGGYLQASSVSSGTWTYPTVWSPFPSSGAAGAIYDAFRCVSGCIKAEFIGSTMYDQGLLIGWRDLIFTANASNSAPPPNYTTANKLYSLGNNESYPLRNGVCVLWTPADYTDSVFLNTNAQSTGESYPIIGIGLTGAQASTALLKIRIVFNYEGIAGNDTANFVDTTVMPPLQNTIEAAGQWGQIPTDKITPLWGGNNLASNANNQLASSLATNLSRMSLIGGGALGGASTLLGGAYMYAQRDRNRNRLPRYQYEL